MLKADVGILTVIPAELKAVRAALGISTEAKEKDTEGTTFWRCTLVSKALQRPLVIVAGCIGDAGNYSAATATTRMIARYKPRVVFLVGIAAGLRGKVKIGEVVLAERIVAYEQAAAVVDRHGRSTLQRRPEIHRIPHRIKQDLVAYLADSPPTDRLQQIFASIGGTFPVPPPSEAEAYAHDVVDHIEAPSVATVASGEKLLRDPSVLLRVREKIHGKTEVGEMEAAGFVEACRPGDVQWLVVRGISDFGDTFKNDAFHNLAARAAATVLVDFLTHGLELDLTRTPPPVSTRGPIDPDNTAAVEPDLDDLVEDPARAVGAAAAAAPLHFKLPESVSSVHPPPDRIVAPTPVDHTRLPGGPRAGGSSKALFDLFGELFGPDTAALSRFLSFGKSGDLIRKALPCPPASFTDVAARAVDLVRQYGVAEDTFARLRDEYHYRVADIDAVAAQWARPSGEGASILPHFDVRRLGIVGTAAVGLAAVVYWMLPETVSVRVNNEARAYCIDSLRTFCPSALLMGEAVLTEADHSSEPVKAVEGCVTWTVAPKSARLKLTCSDPAREYEGEVSRTGGRLTRQR